MSDSGEVVGMPSATPTFLPYLPPPTASGALSHLPPPPQRAPVAAPRRSNIGWAVFAVLVAGVVAIPFVLIGGVFLMLAFGPTPTC